MSAPVIPPKERVYLLGRPCPLTAPILPAGPSRCNAGLVAVPTVMQPGGYKH